MGGALAHPAIRGGLLYNALRDRGSSSGSSSGSSGGLVQQAFDNSPRRRARRGGEPQPPAPQLSLADLGPYNAMVGNLLPFNPLEVNRHQSQYRPPTQSAPPGTVQTQGVASAVPQQLSSVIAGLPLEQRRQANLFFRGVGK